jgi:hypothetical protein
VNQMQMDNNRRLTLPGLEQHFTQKQRGRTTDQVCGLRQLAAKTLPPRTCLVQVVP